MLNAWSKSERAIVTELPGTTRDVVESQLVVQGIPVQILDTAGIRERADVVEQIGVMRSLATAEAADLVLLVIEAQAGWTALDEAIYEQVQQQPLILAINKIDLAPDAAVNHPSAIAQVVTTAAAQSQGIAELEQAILKMAQAGLQAKNLDLAINQRQAAALIQAKTALQQVQATITEQLPLDFWTIDLRCAIAALGEVTGEEVTESVLNRIFSQFCIGK